MNKKRFAIIAIAFLILAMAIPIQAATKKATMKKGKTLVVNAKIGDTVKLKAKSGLTWKSSKKSVATVKKSGKYGIVTTKKAGTVKITAKKGKTKYTCKLIISGKGTADPVFVDPGQNPVITPTPKPTPTPTPAQSGSPEISYTISDTYVDHYINAINIHQYSAICIIHNNSQYGLYVKKCRFDIEDANGHLVATDYATACPSVVGKYGYLYVSYGELTKCDENAQLYLKCYPTVEILKNPVQRCAVSDVSGKVNTLLNTLNVVGRVNNNSSEVCSVVPVHFIFINASELPIYGECIYVNNIAPGSFVSFSNAILLNRMIQNGTYNGYYVLAQMAQYYQ